MHPSFRATRWFRRSGRSVLIAGVACAAMLGSTALALPATATASRRSVPAPTAPAPAAGAAAPIHASHLGVATGVVFWHDSPAARDAELADLESIGVRYVRTAFPWESIEAKGHGTYRWNNADAIVAEATAHHITLIAQVIGAPAWAVRGSAAPRVADYSPNPAPYANFVANFAARYAPLGVTIYELGNEPNRVRPGNPQPDAARYARLLCATYRAVKQVVRHSTVLTGGLGGTKDGAGSISGPTFVRSLYADDAKGCFDGISYHPYTYPQLAPDNGTRGWTGMLTVRQVMVANGDSAKKIWATEYGAPTNGPSVKRVTTEATQAAILTIAYRLFDSYSWAGPLCWFDYEDKGANPKVQDDWFGLRRANGTPKPAYDALAGLGRTAVT